MVGLAFWRQKKLAVDTTPADNKHPSSSSMFKDTNGADLKHDNTLLKPSNRRRVKPISPVVLRNKLIALTNRPQSTDASVSHKSQTLPPSVRSPDHRQTWDPSCVTKEASNEEGDQPAIRIQFRGKIHASKKVWSGTLPSDMPSFGLQSPDGSVFSAVTGPDNGLEFVDECMTGKTSQQNGSSPISSFWKRFSSRKCFGCSQSLYDKHPFTGNVTGDPNADSYFAVARSNCFLLGIADGVNWGEHSRLASRAALNGCWSHLQPILFPDSENSSLPIGEQMSAISTSTLRERPLLSSMSLTPSSRLHTPSAETIRSQITQSPKDTQAAFQLLLEAMWSAQDRIVDHTHIGFTTFCLVLILPLAPPSRQFAACSINVGDSLAFLLSKYHGVREITVGSHVGPDEARNIRDTGGALGAVNEDTSPALHNLTCSLTLCDPGDLVFLTSDGISDNFDPVVMRWATKPCTTLRYIDETDDEEMEPVMRSTNHLHNDGKSAVTSPCNQNCKGHPLQNDLRASELCFVDLMPMTGHERRHYGMKEMERVWHEEELLSSKKEYNISAREFCFALQHEVKQRTQARRDVIEDRKLYRGKMSSSERQSLHAMVQQKLRLMPGKLDHATLVACEVGHYRGDDYEVYEDTVSLLSSHGPEPHTSDS